MSERFITTDTGALPFIGQVSHREAYNILARRKTHEDIDWYVGHPQSLRAHPLGYERDEVTPSHNAAILRSRVWGAKGSLRNGTLVAYKSIIIPKDTSKEGVEAFLHDKLSGKRTAFQQYASVLVNEPDTFGRGTADEETYLFKLPTTGRNLASLAIHHHLNGVHFPELIDEHELPSLRAAHKNVQDRLLLVHAADGERIKKANLYNF